MDAISVVKAQHRRIEALLEGPLEPAAEEIAIHSTVEELFLLPALRVRQTQARLPESFDDHHEIKDRLVAALRGGDLAALKETVRRHFREEESETLPLLERLMTADELEQLGRELDAETRVIHRRRDSHRHPQPY